MYDCIWTGVKNDDSDSVRIEISVGVSLKFYKSKGFSVREEYNKFRDRSVKFK